MKKIILSVSSVGVILLLLIVVLQGTMYCYNNVVCRGFWGGINSLGEFLLVPIPLFIFSLITYRMKDEVFTAWWNFARWWIPVILVGTFCSVINLGGTGYGDALFWDALFYRLILSALYGVFVVVSLWKIIRTQFWLKKMGKY